MKRLFCLLLSGILLLSCLNGSMLTATAASGNALLFNGFNSTADLNATGVVALAGSSTKALDTTNKMEGAGSLRIDMAATNPNFLNPYGYYFDVDRSYIDYSKYNYVEVLYKSDVAHAGSYNLQLHLIDTAVSVAGSGYDYDTAISLDGNWHRLSQNLASPYYTLAGIGNNINRIRVILLNYTGAYQQTDMNIDGLFFCDNAYYTARAAAEQEVAAQIAALPQVTESNYLSLASQFTAVETLIAQGQTNYVNFLPANFADYVAKKTRYNAFASGSGVTNNFAMPNFFADNMMFQRNKPMNLFGVSTTGKTIYAELYETNETIVPIERASVTVPTSGNWSLSFAPREGSYQHYRIVVYENNVVMRVIHTVYIGELWLAVGQSNMEYRLDWEKDGATEIANANDPYLRALIMTNNPVGTSGTPRSTPAFDIHGAAWIDSTNHAHLAGVSSNAYYAAKQLRQGLDMPVGIINSALGSTNIQTWLTREAIESSPSVKTALQQNGLYMTEAQSATTAADYRHMTAMFNTKVGPLAGMNLGGVWWCQGESNRDGAPNNYGYYKEAIQALASGYSKLFGFENGDMPVIVINIANHPYLNDAQNIPKWIEEIADAAATHSNIVNIPIYDVPLTYKNPPDPSVAYSIHPNTKKPGGTRAGLAALHNFCKEGNGDYYAPTVKSYEVKNGAIYVTFNNTVNGLTTLNNSIGVHGFTIAGDNGVFLPAKATIEGKNVVKVSHESITEPVNFTYAFNSYAQTANLCNSYSLPAVPYRSNRDMTNYFCNNDWMYCDDTTVFINDGINGNYNTTWQPSGPATLAIDTATRYEGGGSVKLNYTLSSIGSASAVATFGQYLMPFNLGSYQTVSVMVKNPDSRDKTMQLLVGIAGTNDLWTLSSANNTGAYQVTVPANSDFTRYTFVVADAQGVTTNAAYNPSKITRMDISVADSTSGTIYVDDVTVGTAEVDLPPFTSYTDSLVPIFHVGLSSGTSSDTNWGDYRYIGQEFIPETNSISGVKLPLNLTSGKATLHLEIRSSINGTAIASTDVQLQSQGNGMYWYDIPFQKEVSLKAYRPYYFVYYLTARDASSVCITYGRDLGINNATHLGYAWLMANGGTPTLDSLSNQLQFGFQLLTEPVANQEELDKAAAKVVQDQIAALNVQSLDDKASVEAARKAYNALTAAQKEYVTNLSKLTSAESKITELEQIEADKAAAKVVQNQIAALNVQSLDDKASVEAARKAYNALTAAQQAYVTNLNTLKAAEAEILRLEQLPPYGDVDGDGNITAADALEVLKAVVGNVTLTADQEVLADVDGDGKVSSADALYILKKVVNIIDKFPVEQ